MHDLVDLHRAAIAQAGVALAEAIATATAEYSAAVAASEATLQVAMERRIAEFKGPPSAATATSAEPPPPRPAITDIDGNIVAVSEAEILPGPDVQIGRAHV